MSPQGLLNKRRGGLSDAWKSTLAVTEELALSYTKIFKTTFISVEVTHIEW